MVERIRHRGPDGEGVHVEGPVAFGHTRLAVIDLSHKAAQPMFCPERRYVLVYNGEVYNFRELRRALEQEGVCFQSSGDTEVVLHALIRWGLAAPARFNGMFAFALWDSRERSLILARDRYGQKPLYWAQNGQLLAFGSEIKAIAAHPAFPVRPDLEGLLEYFTFQNFFSTRTLFQGVRTFPPGCIMRLSVDAPAPEWTRYWDFNFQEPESAAGREEYVAELLRLFRQAVNRQMVSDVEVGAYLSGGIDSGSITALAANLSPGLKTFTCGFDTHSASGMEMYSDERETAEYLSYLLGTEHYQVVLKAGDMERCLPEVVHHLDEPRVGQSYPNYYTAKLASRFVKVVLAGTGGDELFGGYPWRYYRAVVNKSFEAYVDTYYKFWQRLIPDTLIRQVFAPVWGQVSHVRTRDIFRDVLNGHNTELCRPEDYVNRSLYFEAKTFLHGLLMVEDKLTMARGLECRTPFLDNDLVDFAMRLPVSLKLGNLGEVVRLNENHLGNKVKQYYQQTRDGKLILRQAMEHIISPRISNGAKRGLSGPDATWFKGDSMDFIRRKFFNGDSRIFAYLDREAVRRLVTEHLEGRSNRRLLIWSLLCFEEWCGQHVL
jgi:asparagine synthase (glutamine-hydrolysing)